MKHQQSLKSFIPKNPSRRTESDQLSSALLQKLRENPRKLDKLRANTLESKNRCSTGKISLYKKANKIFAVYICILSIFDDNACTSIFPPTNLPNNKKQNTSKPTIMNTNNHPTRPTRDITPETRNRTKNINKTLYLPLKQQTYIQTLPNPNTPQKTQYKPPKQRRRKKGRRKLGTTKITETVIQTNTADITQHQDWPIIPQLISLLYDNFPASTWLPQYLLLQSSSSKKTLTYHLQNLTISYKILEEIPRQQTHIQGIVAHILQLIVLFF